MGNSFLNGVVDGANSRAGGDESAGGCNPSAPIGSGTDGCAATLVAVNSMNMLENDENRNGSICIEFFFDGEVKFFTSFSQKLFVIIYEFRDSATLITRVIRFLLLFLTTKLIVCTLKSSDLTLTEGN